MPMLSQQKPNKTKSVSKTASSKSVAESAAGKDDAIILLKEDHKEVSRLFERFEATKSPSMKQQLVAKICAALTVHAQIEEEIFYPAARDALKTDDENLIDEAEVEHDTIKQFVAELEGAPTDADFYDARVKVLGEYVKHHVQDEETEMFPKLRKTKMDMGAIGEELATRKNELTDVSQKNEATHV